MLGGESLSSIILHGTFIGQLILLILLLMSSWAWAVIYLKWKQFQSIQKQNKKDLDAFSQSSSHKNSQPHEPASLSITSTLIQLMYRELELFQKKSHHRQSISEFHTRLSRLLQLEVERFYPQLETRLNNLATISSAAPFVGLLGTVLGVIDAFQGIGSAGVTSLAVVAPGIAEALIATAAGLLAAIPALVAYNAFQNRAQKIAQDLSVFATDLANHTEHKLLTHGVSSDT